MIIYFKLCKHRIFSIINLQDQTIFIGYSSHFLYGKKLIQLTKIFCLEEAMFKMSYRAENIYISVIAMG